MLGYSHEIGGWRQESHTWCLCGPGRIRKEKTAALHKSPTGVAKDLARPQGAGPAGLGRTRSPGNDLCYVGILGNPNQNLDS
jgi:hypothetical protein